MLVRKKSHNVPIKRDRRKITGWTPYIAPKNGTVVYAEDWHKASPIHG